MEGTCVGNGLNARDVTTLPLGALCLQYTPLCLGSKCFGYIVCSLTPCPSFSGALCFAFLDILGFQVRLQL